MNYQTNRTVKHFKKHIIFACIFLSTTLFAQRICDNTKTNITLSDGIIVNVYKARGSDLYYYVPKRFQISKKNGNPEYTFQEYKTSSDTSPQGAILHCLITWGLTKTQHNELERCIKEKFGKTAILGGGISLEAIDNQIRFSNTPLGNILNASLKSKGSLPTLSSSKMALSFRIKKSDVTTVREALKQSHKFKSTTLNFKYRYKAYTCNSGYNPVIDNTITLIGKLKDWF